MNNIELEARRKNNQKKNRERKEKMEHLDKLKLTKWNTIRNCDVIITSSSRPELLKLTLQYFKTNVHFHGNFRFILNEDYVIPKESKKLVQWAEKSGYFKKEDIHCNNPPLGLDKAINRLVHKVKTPYFFYLQDDWILERCGLDLDRALYTMEQFPNINTILFHKYKVPDMLHKIRLKEYFLKKIPQHLVLYFSWEGIPNLTKTSKMKEILKVAMKDSIRRNMPAKITHAFRNSTKKADYDFLYNNVGIFLWGYKGEPRWFRHIGENARMESWRLEEGKPGKEGVTQEQNVIQMAPWLKFIHLPEVKGRNSVRLIKEHLLKTRRTIQ